MSKFNNFNPATAGLLVAEHGDYQMIERTDVEKFVIVKNNKVLMLVDKDPQDQIDSELKRWIESFEYNAKRELELLRASIAKRQRFIEEIQAVYEEK